MTATRKKDSTGRVRYEVDFDLDGWRIQATLWPNEPDGVPRFVVTGREQTPSTPAERFRKPLASRPLPEPVSKALQMIERDYKR